MENDIDIDIDLLIELLDGENVLWKLKENKNEKLGWIEFPLDWIDKKFLSKTIKYLSNLNDEDFIESLRFLKESINFREYKIPVFIIASIIRDDEELYVRFEELWT